MRKVRPKEGNLLSQVQTACISNDLWFPGLWAYVYPPLHIMPLFIPHPYPLACIFQQCVTMPREGRDDGGSHPKTPEVKSALRRDRDVHLSLDSRWSRRLQRILQGWVMFTIRGNVPGWISRHGSHCPPLKAGFSKHTWTGDRSQMGASRRRGRRRKVPCLASGGRGSVTPPPNQSGFPCAGLTRGSW